MSNWREFKLGDIAELRREGFNPNGKIVLPYIGLEHIEPRGLRLNSLGQSSEVTSQKAKFYPLDILYGKLRPYFKKVYFPQFDGVCSTDIYVIKPKYGIDPKFLFYMVATDEFTSIANSGSSGTHMPRADWKHMSESIWSVPDLSTQTAIAEILSSLDNKIELNNKINKDLEALAQALFKQWFVDFEFPNEDGLPYKSSGGEMVESELGEIPKGWRVSSLEEIANIAIGRTPPRKEHEWFSNNPIDVKWISIRDMGLCGTYIYNTSEYLTEEAVEKFRVPIIEANTVIISFKLTVGRVSITTERMLSNEAIAHINLKSNIISQEFIYLYLKQFDFDSLGSTSSIATAVNSKAIKSLPFIHPDLKSLADFLSLIQDNFKTILNITFESKELSNLRDTLLPKLISGELEVSEALAEM